MKPIHQIYCTHCSYGSSALEQREGELAERVLGYSARAGSLERNELRNSYRQIERFLYYYLPSDAPAEEKLRLDAATAPRRLFYCPAMGGLQMVGQVSYRQYDTVGRVGSYFAHVLFSPVADGPWSPLDCLRLWGAAWVEEDSPSHPFLLPVLSSFDELLDGDRAAVDDGVLLSFLTTPAGGEFDDPGEVVPERWRAALPEERISVLTNLLQGYLDLGSNRRESVLLVVEPSLAALLFYGAARLLPASTVREAMSFSTYEPNADRLPVSLAATTFHDPDVTDLRPEAYRRRGFVENTYMRRQSDAGSPAGNYARLVVETLIGDGWEAVDRLLADFEACGRIAAPGELELLAQTERLVPQLLDPSQPPGDMGWRQSELAMRYLGHSFHRHLAGCRPDEPPLSNLAASPAHHLLVLEFLAAEMDTADLAAVRHLLEHLPADKFGELLASERIAAQAKVHALVYYIDRQRCFPEHCDLLFNEASGPLARRAGRGEPLLPAVLAKVDPAAVAPLYAALPESRVEAFLHGLLRACPLNLGNQQALKRVLAELLETMDDARLVSMLSRQRDELRACCPKPDAVLSRRLSRLLFELPERPRHFAERLDVLRMWTDYFAEPGLAEERLGYWQKLRTFLTGLREWQEQQKSAGRFDRLFKRNKPPEYRAMAESLKKAMPRDVYPDDESGTRKQDCLQQLALVLLGDPHFPDHDLRNLMACYYSSGLWTSGRLGIGRTAAGRYGKRRGKGKGKGNSSRSPAAFLYSTGFLLGLGGAVVVAGICLFRTLTQSPDRGAQPTAQGQAGASEAAVAPQPAVPPPQTAPPQAPAPSAPQRSETSLPAQGAAPGGTQAAKSAPAEDDPRGKTPMPEPAPAAGRPAAAPDGSPEKPAAGAKPKPDAPTATGSGEPAVTAQPPRDNPPVGSLPPPGSPEAATEPLASNTAPPAPLPPRVVVATDYVSLPDLDGDLSQVTRPVTLKAWDQPAAVKVTFVLHGVDWVNQHVQRVEMFVEPSDEGLTVSCRPNDAGKKSKSTRLAKFVTTPQELQFRWVALKVDQVAERHCQEGLRSCVLEIDAGDSNWYVALCEPLRLDSLPLEEGVAKADVAGLAKVAGVALDDLKLQLGHGRIDLDDGQGFRFGFAGGKPPFSVKSLAEFFELGDVRVRIDRGKLDRGAWKISLSTVHDKQLAAKNKERDSKQRIANSIRKKLNQLGRPGLSTREWAELAGGLAKQMKLDPPEEYPEPPADLRTNMSAEQAYMTELQNYKNAIEQRIVAPARARQQQLQMEVSQLEQETDDMERAAKAGEAGLKLHAGTVSAVLHRSVDNIRVDAVVVGAPDAAPLPLGGPLLETPPPPDDEN